MLRITIAWDQAPHKKKEKKWRAKRAKRCSLGSGKGVRGMSPGSAALSPSPGHRWFRFACRYFPISPRFLPFSPTAQPGPSLGLQ